MNGFIATADTQEAHDIANGKRRIYTVADTHTEKNIWDNGEVFWADDEPMPDGVWISSCGNWRTVHFDGNNEVGRNFCYCPFCKSLRRAASYSDEVARRDTENRLREIVSDDFSHITMPALANVLVEQVTSCEHQMQLAYLVSLQRKFSELLVTLCERDGVLYGIPPIGASSDTVVAPHPVTAKHTAASDEVGSGG